MDSPEKLCSRGAGLGPTVSPAPTPYSVSVVVTIYFDRWQSETSWKITDKTGDVVYRYAPLGSYTTEDYVKEVVYLPPDEEYMFTIFDARGDGIKVYLDGIAYDITLTDQDIGMVLLDGDGSFGREREHRFQVPSAEDYPTAAPAIPTASPAPSEFMFLVLVRINFDLFHEQLSWKIADASNSSIVYAEVVVGTYRIGDGIEEEVRLPPGRTYRFTIQDDYGNGIDGVDGGYSLIGLLAEDDEVTLAQGDGKFEDRRGHIFELPEMTGSFQQEDPETSFPSHEPTSFPSTDPTDSLQSCVKIWGGCTLSKHCCSGRCINGGCKSSASSRGGRPKLSGNRGGAAGGA